MSPLFALLAPLALLLPDPAGVAAPPAEVAPLGIAEVPVAEQVRIEQRVIVKIAPRTAVSRPTLMAQPMPQAQSLDGFTERKMDKCLPVGAIAAAQPHAGRLLFFLRDRRLVSVQLDKTCLARDFYSGFYFERTKDGKLCAGRDKIQSRAGANCGVRQLRELVPAD